MLCLLKNMTCDQWQQHGYSMDLDLFKFATTDLRFRNPKTEEALRRILVDGEKPPQVRRDLSISRSTVEDAKKRLLKNLDKRAKAAGIIIRSSVAVDQDHLDMVNKIHEMALAPHIVKDD